MVWLYNRLNSMASVPPPQILMAVERERDFAEMWGDLSTSIKVKKIFGVL